MRVALQKLDGVQKVTVTLNDGQAKIALKRGNTVTLAAIRRLIESKGFTPQDASVLAEVTVTDTPGGGVRLSVTGIDETFPLAGGTPDAVLAALKREPARAVVVGASVRSMKDDPSGSMAVREVR